MFDKVTSQNRKSSKRLHKQYNTASRFTQMFTWNCYVTVFETAMKALKQAVLFQWHNENIKKNQI
ncbi:hypothetical protein FD09_GL000327 [Schleiferilactobacillus perolens DSM 12744]|uniref:Uncharacterized protein n=1 Tax=Schleiferilactobacillus perolens DSM 12744 TaxID=1423792 RepID=A0A0R1N353_9LACO|nr:hypothetical protein FD09_GL000327 [Schleiferilactobacillus perolens DSM 12744]